MCGKGYCGSLQTDDPTSTGCTSALPGEYGNGLGLRTDCPFCKAAGFQSYSDKQTSSSCKLCSGLAANTGGTGCGELVACATRPSVKGPDRIGWLDGLAPCMCSNFGRQQNA